MLSELHRKYLIEGARRGAGYGFGFRHGSFEGGSGIKLGMRTGNSLEFMEHRDYVAGDDLRQLDWNVYARTEKLTVKLFREEINPRLDLIIDGSASMELPSSEKAEAALGLAGLLSTAAGNSGYHCKTWICGEELKPVANGSGPAALWDGIALDGKTSPAEALRSFTRGFQYHGIRIVISDLLWNDAPQHFLGKLTVGASAVILIQMLADCDLNPPVSGRVRLCDSETGAADELYLDADALDKYRSTLAGHQQNWERACREHGASLLTVNAGQMVKSWDMRELMAKEIINAI
jgi:uncharacterized protein (DUF58 family)